MTPATLDEGAALLAAATAWPASGEAAQWEAWLLAHAADLIALARQAQDNAKVFAALGELVACNAIVKAGDGRKVRGGRWSKAWDEASAAIAAATPDKAVT